MTSRNLASFVADPIIRRSCLCSIFFAAFVLLLILFSGNEFVPQKHLMRFEVVPSLMLNKCKNQCRLDGSETLPEGIVSKTSNLKMRPLWGFPKSDNSSKNLFAMAVGTKQSDLVDKMVRKFLSSNFAVMLFHYDGIVDQWKTFKWHDSVIHVSAADQTKWWFAKRFLHPDIVAEYSYIFLWDEDLGVENFNPNQYLSIIMTEGLEISQPALDSSKSEVHHQITGRSRRSVVHRRVYRTRSCNKTSKGPPCTGWIEMMAPVFSRAAWRCVWYMIQNDLIHAWGLDMQLGYCAQGDRTKNVGIVDAEYIVHYGHPTLGGPDKVKQASSSRSHLKDPRLEVRRQSYIELKIFQRRWREAANMDQCWVDPYTKS